MLHYFNCLFKYLFQHGYVIDGGKPLEIRPISSRLRKMLQPPVEDAENDFVMVGAHILRAVDPLPRFRAHQAECDGK